jgi:hypothetical protein
MRTTVGRHARCVIRSGDAPRMTPMNLIEFPTRGPHPDELVVLRAKLVELSQEISLSMVQCTSAIAAAKTPEDLVVAVRKIHQTLAANAEGFAKLVDAARRWH